MFKKKKNKLDEDQDFDEEEFLDEEEEDTEENHKGMTPKATQINFQANFDILKGRLDKIENALSVHQKYIKQFHERIKELQDNFRLLIEK